MNPRAGIAQTLALSTTALALFAANAAPVRAVLLAEGDGSRNLDTPREVPALGRVVERSGFGAVYLENGWVLTARHVSAGAVRIAGENFDPIPGSLREFANADGTLVDLLAFRIDPGAALGLPGLAPLEIARRPPAPGSLVYLRGAGSNRGQALRWSMGALGERRGWEWGSGNALRWGTNRVSGTRATVTMGEYRSKGFSMVFGQPGGANTTEHEAAVAIGDSGGGVVAKLDGRWVLCGVLVARTTHPGQPDDTAAYGNRILAVDLSQYRERILAIVQESPLPPPVPRERESAAPSQQPAPIPGAHSAGADARGSSQTGTNPKAGADSRRLAPPAPSAKLSP